MKGDDVLWFVVFVGALNIGYGLYAMVPSFEVARRNAAFIDSGKEAYLEQRRSWKVYGTTPPRNAIDVRRGGRKELLAGIVMLAIALTLHFVAQG
jgi:hypothetical protein